jgi:glycosyltransferase involved in cell wall biosynthesis
MLVSIITVCYNSKATISAAIQSVIDQDYKNIEYVIIDGGSTDGTLDIIRCYENNVSVMVSEKDDGIYDAMNKGLRMSTGSIIGILNSDDFFPKSDVISKVVESFSESKTDIIFGNVVFVEQDNIFKKVRKINPNNFKPWKLRFGWMPPHPATFIKRTIYDGFGIYNKNYKSGADYEFFVRVLLRQSQQYMHINKDLVHMRLGGTTTSGMSSYWRTSLEMVRSLRENGYWANIIIILARLPIKYFREKL